MRSFVSKNVEISAQVGVGVEAIKQSGRGMGGGMEGDGGWRG